MTEVFRWENMPEDEELKLRQKATVAIDDFKRILKDIENIEPNEIVDLREQSKVYPDLSKGDALETALRVLKTNLDYLYPKNRQEAEGDIIRAEMYIAAYTPSKKEID